MDLSEWRARIDAVDQQLVDLLNQRLQCVLEIGKLKRQHGRPVQDHERERAIIERLTAYNQGPLSNQAIIDLFTRIMQEARKLEEGHT
ncbi:MAG: chorismate mutase [Candidatus Handelsmanbacteria bacterium]|nr:chorismate mutase [Candidatus Handelsmanbacteria bacterium]